MNCYFLRILEDVRCVLARNVYRYIIPRHLEDDLKVIIFSQYFNGTRELITICLHRSGASDLVISLLALHKIKTWSRINLHGPDYCMNIIIKGKYSSIVWKHEKFP